MKEKDKQTDLNKAFYKTMCKLQDLDTWVSNKANDLANKWGTKQYQVYFKSLDKLNAMATEIDAFTKGLKKTMKDIK